MTLVTEVERLETAIRSLQAALTSARLVENEAKGTAWTADGQRPAGERAGAMWDNAVSHEGFVLAGCPGTFEELAVHAPSPIPVGSQTFVEEFLRGRAEYTRVLTQKIAELPRHAPAGLPAVQAASCLLRECVPQRSNHLLRVLATDRTEEFAVLVDETTAQAAERILDLPTLVPWQREALFVPAARGGWGLWNLQQRRHAARIGGMIAAPAPPAELENAAVAAKTGRDLGAELDAFKMRFDVDGPIALERSWADLAAGDIAGGQSVLQTLADQVTTRRHRESLSQLAADWMEGASSVDALGSDISPGASAWVDARPVGQHCILHDRQLRIAARLRLMVPMCAPGTPCSCAPAKYGAKCGDCSGRSWSPCPPVQSGTDELAT